MFYVSDGNEIVEHRERNEPQTIKTLPVGISGRLSKIAEVDQYQFQPTQDGSITVDLMARRLGSDLHGQLEIRDGDNRLLATTADTEGIDTSLTFAAKKGNQYTVRLHDIDFRGNRAFVYRLFIQPGPRVLRTIPPCGVRGKKGQITFVGYGLKSNTDQLETKSQQIDFPKTGNAFRYKCNTKFGVTEIVIPMSDHPELTEPTNRSKTHPTIPVPGAITGTLEQSNEQDRYTFQAKKGESWNIELQSRVLGTNLDVALEVLRPDGKRLANFDNLPGTTDAGGVIRTPKDGSYTCVVRDLSGHDGTPLAIYRLAITKLSPDFSLSLPQQLKVQLGAKLNVVVKAQRFDGFQEPIELRVKGLPAEITGPRTITIPAKKTNAKFVFTCPKDSSTKAAMLQITGTAKIGDKTVTRFATATASGNLAPRFPGDTFTDQIILARTMSPPFSVELVDKNRQRAVHRGTTYPAEFLIKREPGFTGPVQLQMASKQARHRQGMTAPILTVPAKTTRILYPCFLPEWLETDRTSRMVVLGVAKFADPKGIVRYLTKPANARITMILEGALLKVQHDADELTVTPGKSFQIPLVVSRSPKLKQQVKLELVVPPELSKVLSAKSITLGPKEKRGTLEVTSTPSAKLRGDWEIMIQATALKDNRWPVVSQTKVSVRFVERR